MAPLIPRLHLFEIHDQPWFPPFLRAWVQSALTEAWTFHLPFSTNPSAATFTTSILSKHLASSLTNYTFVDFCAGAGGPTPSIERLLNQSLSARGAPPVKFILTDLHPHVASWEAAAAQSEHLGFEPGSVDAANAPREVVERHTRAGAKVIRLFNLAFHHFGDGLARAILKNTVETSHGFVIFELQDRSFDSFVMTVMFGIGILLSAPYYAWKWRAPHALFFTYILPILPFVLLFDGWVSSVRMRTPDEVEVLLRTCGTDTEGWEVKGGQERHFWPSGYLHWTICMPRNR